MEKAKRHFYDSNKNKKDFSSWNSQDYVSLNPLEIKPLVKFEDTESEKSYDKYISTFKDSWINQVASIDSNNSIAQFNQFVLDRLSYAECSHLATDTIINTAIIKYQNELLRNKGEIVISEDLENKEDIVKALEVRLKDLKFYDKLNEIIATSLTYGKADLYIDTDTNEREKELYYSKEVLSKNKINDFKIVPPYLTSPINVNTYDVLDKNYMNPINWIVTGSGSVHISRLIPLVFFDCPLLIKPLYNYGGLSLPQIMKSYVSSAESSRKSIADLLLRFRTDVLKSDLAVNDQSQAIARAKAYNQSKNNLGVTLLTNQESIEQINTALSGIDKLSSHMMEYVAVSSGLTVVELFGLSPSGFNASGSYEMQSYYNKLNSLESKKIIPIIEKVLHLLCLEMELDIKPTYELKERDSETELEKAQLETATIDNTIKLIDAGIITEEQAFELLSQKGVTKSLTYEEPNIEEF